MILNSIQDSYSSASVKRLVRISPGTTWAEPSTAGRQPGWTWRSGISPGRRWGTRAAPTVHRRRRRAPLRSPLRKRLRSYQRCPLLFPTAVRPKALTLNWCHGAACDFQHRLPYRLPPPATSLFTSRRWTPAANRSVSHARAQDLTSSPGNFQSKALIFQIKSLWSLSFKIQPSISCWCFSFIHHTRTAPPAGGIT